MVIGTLERKTTMTRLTVAMLILGLFISFFPIIGTGGLPPLPEDIIGLPAVTIKTQTAANNVPGGIRGIDVSEYQGNINWEAVATDNVNFAICRASYGLKADKNFYTNARGAYANGLKVGAYHYAKFTDRASMVREAEYFLSLVKNVDITYPVVLDVEANRGMNKNTLTQLSIEFLELIRNAGYTPMLYSYTNFYRDHFNMSMLSNYDLWVANYITEPNIGQKIWQHTSYGGVKGITGRVDINIAYDELGNGNKKILVNREISNSIKSTLNQRHNSGIPEEGLEMTVMREAVVTALQSELNRQMGSDLAVTGIMNESTLNVLSQVPFVKGQTKGNMTYLIQVMLFYRGYYTQSLTGAYDDYMSDALQGYQRGNELSITGKPDRETLWQLLG